MNDTATQQEADLLARAEHNRRQKAEQDRIAREAREKQNEADALKLSARLESLGQKIAANPIKPAGDLADPRIVQAKQLFDAAGVPKRHGHRIEPVPGPWQTTLEKISARLGNGFLIPVSGEQGRGKTQLGSALIYAATDKAMTARYAIAMDFFIAIKSTFKDTAKKTEAEVIAEFVKPKVLVLDEMDERSNNEWENRLLFHMINQRYNNLVDTLLISRSDETTFLNSLGKSIQSRIQETGASIVCDWPSFREGNQ